MSRKYIQNCTGSDLPGSKGAHQADKKVSKIIFYILLVCFVGVLGYVLLFSDYLQVVSIKISGTEEINEQQIADIFNDSIEGKYLNIIPKNNFFFVSPTLIERSILANFKKVRTASVSKKFPSEVSINIEERKALLVWCSAEHCFLIDENGTAYAPANFDSPELTQNHLLKITDRSGAEVTLGENILDNTYTQYLSGVKAQLEQTGVGVGEDFWTPSRMAQEIDMKTTQGFELYLSTQFGLEEAGRALAVLLKKEIPASQQAGLAYIDLRTQNKAFYKFNTPNSDEKTDEQKAAEEKK